MEYTEFKPLKGQVLLKPIVVDFRKPENEFIPDEDIPLDHAEVVSIGAGVEQVALQQIVIYPGGYGFTPVNVHGENLLVGPEEQILLITPHKVILTETEEENEGN